MRVKPAASSFVLMASSSLELSVTRLVGVEGVGAELSVREDVERMGVWTPQKHWPRHLKGERVNAMLQIE